MFENGKTGINVTNGSFAEESSNSPFESKGSQAEITASAFVFNAPSNLLGQAPNLNGPTPTYSTSTSNPLSGLAAPSKTGLPAQSYTGQTTLNPGVYTGVIGITGNAAVTMIPGIYYLQPDGSGNAGITLGGTSSLDGTSGVLIYAAPPATPGSGNLNISNGGNNVMSLNPISTFGTYEGISIFVDSAWGNGNAGANRQRHAGAGRAPRRPMSSARYTPPPRIAS